MDIFEQSGENHFFSNLLAIKLILSLQGRLAAQK